jgi:hypothetical protein
LRTDDDRPGASPVAVISDSYWARKFARDPGVIGRSLLIEGQPVTIVGVTPPGFEGPTVGEAAHVTLSISGDCHRTLGLLPIAGRLLTPDAYPRTTGRLQRMGLTNIESSTVAVSAQARKNLLVFRKTSHLRI